MKSVSVAYRLLPSLLAALGSLSFAQAANPTIQSIDNTVIGVEHVDWKSPESVLNNLRSPNGETRLSALKLAGLNDQQAHHAIWSQGDGGLSKLVGQAVVIPNRSQLMYASIGEDGNQQAILALDDGGQSVYAAVAVRKGSVWERIAALTCWCKYDMRPDQDMLAEFVSLRPGLEPGSPDKQGHKELIIHSSGGGTGVYSQTETHFRVYHNELRSVMSFTSAYRNGTPTVTLERRWFTWAAVPDGTLRAVLVEAKGAWEPDSAPSIQWDVRSLLDRHLRDVECTAFRWDDKSFRYIPTNETIPACHPLPTSR